MAENMEDLFSTSKGKSLDKPDKVSKYCDMDLMKTSEEKTRQKQPLPKAYSGSKHSDRDSSTSSSSSHRSRSKSRKSSHRPSRSRKRKSHKNSRQYSSESFSSSSGESTSPVRKRTR